MVENSFSFWKNLGLAIVFFTITPVAIGASLFSLISLPPKPAETKPSMTGVRVFTSLPSDFPSISGLAYASDGRVEIIRQYLKEYRSPLWPYAETIVSYADQYKIDFRLTTAIAQQESNLCKTIPPGTFNCWGWGIHSQGTLGFSSFEEGIKTVTMGLATSYFNQGYDTPEKIMTKYAPASNGSWAEGVTQFLSEME
ncbi:hypothetical protein COT08_00635 [Candidatus Woesebacteria bacterium CG07_land_8_20_14_0_80_44_9]|uniref:Mannosyl-glycoprotein endo-beta-N-acetylglucosamidase-like domain-containing protein n=1 Tax=Candidatus Woesebacteria bacterium CG07_land_8_20_14_0_80_44_9 TaxID=1975058 RepID=A0A2M6YEY6_9BACT|nr:MAG: hypothetical protein COT08_00635 [Candidatus Woesebacteria bacterium CG07_land_8_20_14_0_80_44_9]